MLFPELGREQNNHFFKFSTAQTSRVTINNVHDDDVEKKLKSHSEE